MRYLMIPIRGHANDPIISGDYRVIWDQNYITLCNTLYPNLGSFCEWYSLEKVLLFCDRVELELVRHTKLIKIVIFVTQESVAQVCDIHI